MFWKRVNWVLVDKIDNSLYQGYQERTNFFKGLIQEDLKEVVEFKKTSAAETESLNAIKDTLPVALKESMALQLEATYRKNVQTVATELKRRIDYLKETEETKARFEKEQLLKLINDSVSF